MGHRTVLILTGEPSGDAAAARVVEALRRRASDLRFLAVGGPRLEAAGCTLVERIESLSVMGVAEVIQKLPALRALESRLRRILVHDAPALVVPVDYPGFNLRIAAFARRRGIPVVYYIGPQVWAWGAGRLPRIGRAVDRVLVVFPFETAIYERAGIPVEHVGHPLLDISAETPDRATARDRLGISREALLLGLLPGSRRQEIRRIFPVMAQAATLMRADRPALRVVASTAPGIPRSEYDAVLERTHVPGLQLSQAAAAEIAAAADILLVTSGTATLECALAGTPLAVLYRTSALTWFLGRRLVRIPHISLVNIVAGEALVPEFLQNAARPDAVAAWAGAMLADEPRRRELGGRLAALAAKLGAPGTAERAADALLRAMAGA